MKKILKKKKMENPSEGGGIFHSFTYNQLIRSPANIPSSTGFPSCRGQDPEQAGLEGVGETEAR